MTLALKRRKLYSSSTKAPSQCVRLPFTLM
jgi:hypothetical protein